MGSDIQFLLPYLRRHKAKFALGISALVLKDASGVVLPLLIKSAIDALTAGKPLSAILFFAALMVAVTMVKGFFQYWMRVILIGASRDIEFEVRNDLFGKLVSLSPDYYAWNRTGDIMARATNDLNAVRMMLGPGVMYWMETSLTFAMTLGVMLFFDWRLALLSVMPAPLVSFAVIYFGRRIHTRFEAIQELFSTISSRVQENLSGVRMVRAFAQEDAEVRKFEVLNREYIDQNLKLVQVQGVFQPMLEGLIGLTFLIVLWSGGREVLRGHLSVGSFVMFNTYMSTLVWPMIALGWVVNLMQRGRASLGRIQSILKASPTIHPPAVDRTLRVREARVEFRDVSVRYPSGAALRHINLRVPAGQTIGVVGRTGAGKSTLVNLIPRLLDPDTGTVLVDGEDVRDYDPAELRRSVGYVPQETFLFSATLAQNIAFGVEDATRAEIERAARLSGLAEDIDQFPLGYDTMVGERGVTLSGGQKQRTAIARALIRDPKILILDDALASVDTMTEERILTGLAGVMAGRTVILISHRVSTVKRADYVVVLSHGTIAEQGTPLELSRQAGYYADLIQKQQLEEELSEA